MIMVVEYQPIGVIYSPFKKPGETPIQSQASKGTKGTIEVFDPYTEGLNDLDGFSHIILIYQFHLSKGYSLNVIPFLDNQERGVFSTRAPRRPNAIGMSVVELIAVESNILHIRNMDMVDGTPLLDIKPYVPQFEPDGSIRIGWLEKNIEKLNKA
jgi:tRNA-Thr(GGU) m(6)t(6)A37 methyltransferase TsaA